MMSIVHYIPTAPPAHSLFSGDHHIALCPNHVQIYHRPYFEILLDLGLSTTNDFVDISLLQLLDDRCNVYCLRGTKVGTVLVRKVGNTLDQPKA